MAPNEGAMLLADFFRRHGLGGRVNVHLFTPEPQPMPSRARHSVTPFGRCSNREASAVFHEPSPDVQVKSLGNAWHLGKVLFERWWLSPWGVRRSLLRSALAVCSRIYGVPVSL